jgi:hypothetical protein
MALARVVSFDGVTTQRVEEMQRDLSGQEQPEGVRATEIILLHEPDADRALVILFFENEDDYASGDEVLSAMPADETPGRRSAVTKYDVAARMKA